MATIHLTALTRVPGYGGGGGPDVPCCLTPVIRMERIFGEDGPEVPVLWISIGGDNVRIWPVQPDEVEACGNRLISIAVDERLRREQRREGDVE